MPEMQEMEGCINQRAHCSRCRRTRAHPALGQHIAPGTQQRHRCGADIVSRCKLFWRGSLAYSSVRLQWSGWAATQQPPHSNNGKEQSREGAAGGECGAGTNGRKDSGIGRSVL